MQHYPGRLHRLFLVGLPPTLHWMVDTVKQVLHPSTVPKLLVCDVDDLSAPLRSYLQPQAPESPGTPSAGWANGTVSLLTLPGWPNGMPPSAVLTPGYAVPQHAMPSGQPIWLHCDFVTRAMCMTSSVIVNTFALNTTVT